MNYFMNSLFFIYFSMLLHIINLFLIKCKKKDIVGSFMKAFFFFFPNNLTGETSNESVKNSHE